MARTTTGEAGSMCSWGNRTWNTERIRSNWSAMRRACFSFELVATTKCGLVTSIQVSALSLAGTRDVDKSGSSKPIFFHMARRHYRYNQETRKSNQTPLPAREPLVLIFYFAHSDNLRGGTEFLVIPERIFAVDVEAFQQGHSSVNLERYFSGQPDLIIDTGLLQHKARAFVDPGYHPSERHRFNGFHFHLGQLQIAFVDPDPPAKLGKKFRLFHVRLKPGTGLAINDPRLAAAHCFRAYEREIVSIGNLVDKFPVILPLFFLLLCALAAVRLRLISALVDNLLDFL